MKPLLACSLVALTTFATRAFAEPPKTNEIEITVIAILASEKHTEINPRLDEFAKFVRVKEPKLTGFQIGRSTAKKLELGQTYKFDLVDGEVVEVTVNKERNENGRITLTIKPPKLNQITYECVCNKFFAMATQHYAVKDKDRQRLFIAVMAKPCAAKK